MARKVLFDPTEIDSFREQWQRYDWRLLRDGAVHRVDDSTELHRAAAELAGLGYQVHAVDAAGCETERDLHSLLAATLSFPDHYGRNLDALNDVLGEVAQFEYGSDPDATGTVLAIDHYDQVVRLGPRFANAVLDVFALNARFAALLGHPMLCLVATTAELGEVGATGVFRA